MSSPATCRTFGVPSIEYVDDEARCMDCGEFILFGYCGATDCPEVACPGCMTGCGALFDR